jgi:hypothetical protein
VTCVINFAEYRSEMLLGRFRNANWFIGTTRNEQGMYFIRPVSRCLPRAGMFSGVYGKEIVEDDEVQLGVFDDSHLRSEGLK